MKVLVVSGASGGHIFPALSFLEALKTKDRNIKTILVLPGESLKRNLEITGYKIRYLAISAIKLNISRATLRSIFRLAKGFRQSLDILVKFRPDVVVGFGSLASVPLLMLAWFFRIKTLIHEQNVIPGRANRFLARFVDKIAVSFSQTREYFGVSADKIIFTGNPLRKELVQIDKSQARGFFGLESDKFTVLVMGGSQGSEAVNRGFIFAVSKIKVLAGLQVIHLSGGKENDWLKNQYEKLKVKARVIPFLKSMEYAYSASSLVVSRSGATTVQELIRFRLPAILAPYPFAYAHQTANARVLADKGCAVVLEDRFISSDKFTQMLEKFIAEPENLEDMRSAYGVFKEVNAQNLLVEAVWKSTTI